MIARTNMIVSKYPSRMFYFWAADQLLFSSSQPTQLQSYVVCWGGRPLQLLVRILFYNYYRPQPSVSEVDGSEFFDQESFDELEEEELGTKGDWDDDDESTDILMY